MLHLILRAVVVIGNLHYRWCIMMSAGGAVAGPLAVSALVGIGAAALTGGAVLDAVGFPHSPGKVNGPEAMMLLLR